MPKTGTPADLLVVGLGNPGDEYAQTRHNAGQLVVEILAERNGISLKKAMGKALWGHTRVGSKLLALGIPGVYMNVSGESISSLVRRYNIEDLSKLVIVHDELDLELGRIQIKLGGGLAGHNGLKSTKHHLKSDGFARVRVGIGRPAHEQQSVSDYVLRRVGSSEREVWESALETAADAVEAVLAGGIEAAMRSFN